MVMVKWDQRHQLQKKKKCLFCLELHPCRTLWWANKLCKLSTLSSITCSPHAKPLKITQSTITKSSGKLAVNRFHRSGSFAGKGLRFILNLICDQGRTRRVAIFVWLMKSHRGKDDWWGLIPISMIRVRCTNTSFHSVCFGRDRLTSW